MIPVKYLTSVVRAVVPPLIPMATSLLARVRITHPEDNDFVPIGVGQEYPELIGSRVAFRLSCFTTMTTSIGHRAARYWILVHCENGWANKEL